MKLVISLVNADGVKSALISHADSDGQVKMQQILSVMGQTGIILHDFQKGDKIEVFEYDESEDNSGTDTETAATLATQNTTDSTVQTAQNSGGSSELTGTTENVAPVASDNVTGQGGEFGGAGASGSFADTSSSDSSVDTSSSSSDTAS